MVTLEDLFGGKNYGPKLLNLKAEGEFVKGVITRIDEKAPVFDLVPDATGKYRPGNKKYWVDGKPKSVPEDEAQRAGLNPVTQIEIYLKDITGQWAGRDESVTEVKVTATASANEREAFKAALVDAGSIDEGDVFGKKLTKRVGNIKSTDFKIVKQG